MLEKMLKGLVTAFLTVLAAVWLAPLVVVLLNATKSVVDYNNSNFWNIPTQLNILGNVQTVLTGTQLGRGFLNSLIYGVVGGSVAVIVASLAAYSITHFRIKFSFFWFMLIYSGTIFPFQMYLIPIFKLYTQTNLYNTFQGMLIFYVSICIPFPFFVLRNYYSTLDRQILDAAKIDGCSDFRIFRSMIIPQSIPPFLVLFLLQFTWVWNDLVFGLILTQDARVRPVMASLATLQGGESSAGMPVLLMGALIASIPTVILFFSLQKYFLKGLSFGMGSDK